MNFSIVNPNNVEAIGTEILSSTFELKGKDSTKAQQTLTPNVHK